MRRPSFLPSVQLLVFALLLSGCTATTGLFFYPQRIWLTTPDEAGIAYEDVQLVADDGTGLHAWWLRAEGENTGISVLYLHGNGENISTHSRSIYWLVKAGVSVLALDYRGYGASEGAALMPSVLQDIRAAAGWLQQQTPEDTHVVLGQSMGAALAIDFVARYGAQYDVDRLVLDAPFATFPGAARHALSHSFVGWMIWPFTLLVPGDWDPQDVVADITVPVLFMASPDDNVVDYDDGRTLYEKLTRRSGSEPVCWLQSRGRHIASFGYDDLRAATLSFIKTGQCPPLSAP